MTTTTIRLPPPLPHLMVREEGATLTLTTAIVATIPTDSLDLDLQEGLAVIHQVDRIDEMEEEAVKEEGFLLRHLISQILFFRSNSWTLPSMWMMKVFLLDNDSLLDEEVNDETHRRHLISMTIPI